MSAVKNYIEKTVPRYVYLYEENYVNRSKIAPSAIFKEAKQRLINQLSLKTSNDELNNLSNWYQQGIDLLTGFSRAEDGQKLQEAIIKKLEDKFELDLSDTFDFNFSTGGVSIKQGSPQSISKAKKVQTIGSQGLGNSADITRRANKIIETLSAAIANETNIEKKQELKKAVNQIEMVKRSFNNLFQGLNLKDALKSLKDAGISLNENSLKFFQNNSFIKQGKRIDYKTINEYVKILNAVIASFSSSILGHVQGLFTEYIMHAIAALQENIAGNVLEQFEKSLKTGGAQVQEGIVKMFDPEMALKTIQEINRNGTFSSKDMRAQLIVKYHSQQKADIIITLEGKTYPISVKSYIRKTDKKIHLHANSPLTTLLFGEDNINKNIGAHYLNILAEHPQDFKHSNFSIIRQEGLEALILTMLYQAASGKGLGKTSGFAEILTWNDPKDGSIKFFDINSLIAQLADENLFSLANKITKPSLATLKLANPYIKNNNMNEAIMTRLSRVYADAKAKKISIMIPQSLLEKAIPTQG